MPDSKFTPTPTDDATKNVVQIDNVTYLCWTQAGFRKALKLFNCGEKMEVRGYPTKYPAMVVLSLAYTGYEYTRCVTYSMLHKMQSCKDKLDVLYQKDGTVAIKAINELFEFN